MIVAATSHVEMASATDLVAIRALLTDASLPVEDLEGPAALRFWVVRDGTDIVGAIGLERYGDAGLLRSLVVAPERRRSGLGEALVRALERDARAAGVTVLVLLTQTAEPFFRRLRYTVIDRENAPVEVKASAEFRTLCPASAVCMARSIE